VVSALAVATVLVVVLTRQNRALRHEVARVRLEARTPRVGSTVPAFRAVTLAGDSVTIGRGAAQVLFVLTTTCGFCRQTVPVWNRIAARLGTEVPEVQVYGLTQGSDSALRAYQREADVSFAIVPFPDPTLPDAYRIEAVPLTVVVTGDGHLRLVRAGVLPEGVADSVVAAARAAVSGGGLR
jgi:thiol-disulfide isomerase/thioredoxin